MNFSILTPVAIRATDTQRAQMLVECLQSIKNQTHQDYEVILKDAYPQEPVTLHSEVCQILYSMPKVKYICRPDTGMTDGLNQALHAATGEILHIVCGDDSLDCQIY